METPPPKLEAVVLVQRPAGVGETEADNLYRKEFLAGHPAMPKARKEVIAERRIGSGFTPEEVRASWGLPHDRQSMGQSEIWRYGAASVFFRNGLVNTVRKSQPDAPEKKD